MQSKLEFICDRIIEAGWLAAIVFTPLYFNVYSSRVFEPDKISLLRNIVLMMTIAWLIKLVEGYLRRPASTRRPADVAAEATPGWLPSLLRIPMMVPILVYAAVYLLSTLTSIVPLTSIFGSYQRLQGTITQYTYITLALLILANMRSRVQLERLITFGIVTSVPVAAYGIVQALGMDPLPWAGDVQTRVASSMGNAIFVAAWLIMAVPLTLQRWIAAVADRNTAGTEAPPAPAEPRSDPWPLAIIGSAAVFFLVIVQYLGITTGNDLPVAAGVPQLTPNYNTFGDVFLWILVIAVGALFVWLVNNIADQALRNAGRGGAASEPGPPAWLSIANPVIQLAVLGLGIYIVGKVRVPDFSLWIVLPAAIFIFYALSFLYTLAGNTSVLSNRLQLYGLPVLMVMQILVIFLTQSRGPELGLLLGLVIFAFAFLLRRHLYRAFAVSLAVVLLFGAFLLVFNLPDSPIASWRSLPYIGRLGLISQTDEGTGKVRVLIWGGALKMITSDPVRMFIGWGPEAMYVGYNKFYPPDLGHWELRNATPDRSHDVFFDQAVTMGLIGLVAYLFLFGSFLWFAVRALRKAPELHDQLILIGFLSMGLAHLGELVTGIQIAATYTYFYMGVGGVVVLGYVLNDYLRKPVEETAPEEEPLGAAQPAPGLPAPVLASATSAAGAAAAAVPRRGVAPAAAARGGRGPATTVASRGSGPSSRRNSGANGSNGRHLSPAGRNGGGVRAGRGGFVLGSYAANRPAMFWVYGALGLAALVLILGLNVNLVKADMFYKQGLSYDNNQQWPGSIGPYEKAIAISPNEDFYYLFLGRAYMEWAKVQNSNPNTFQGSPPAATLLADAENALNRAKALNPLNTDHYANLGRLYVYWGDSLGGDQQYYAKAVQMYERAHELSPGNAGLWNELALAYAKAGRMPDFETAIRGSQQMDTLYAQTPFIAGEVERSQAEVYASEEKSPPAGVVSATLVLSATQEAQAAAKDYADSITLDSTLIRDSDFENRVQFLQQYNALQPLAIAYQEVISKALAAKAQNPAASDEPAQVRASLGYVEWKMGNTTDAITQFERAVALQCDDFYNLQNLGLLYQQTGDTERELNMYEAALAVADCNSADSYTLTCKPLQQSTAAGTCTPLTGQSTLAQTITDLRTTVQQLKQQLGRQ